MNREMIINELRNKNYVAEPTDVIKNGVEYHGIMMGDGNIKPTIYVDDYLECEDEKLSEIVEDIILIYKNSEKENLKYSPDKLLDWDFVKTKLQLCLQKKGNEHIVKRDFLDLEQYVRVVVDTDKAKTASFKVTPEHLIKFEVTEEQLFNAAWDCTKPTLIEEDMIKIMAEMLHTPEEVLLAMDNAPRQIVLSNRNKIHGAIAMCDTWKLKEIADRYESDLAILPSSIHEVIITPVDMFMKFSYLDNMVQEVNETQVALEEILGDHAYRFNRDTREITYYVSQLLH